MMVLVWMACGAACAGLVVWARQRFASFAAQTPEDYRDEPGAALDLRKHLSGALVAEGVIFGPTGRVVSRFVGDFEGHWEGNTGTLTEHYRYASGKKETRVWRLALGNDGGLRAEASDVIGAGVGQLSGPAAQLRYRLRLPPDAGGHVLNATDWMYLTEDGTVVNRSQFRKFGIKVAELVAVVRPKEAA